MQTCGESSSKSSPVSLPTSLKIKSVHFFACTKKVETKNSAMCNASLLSTCTVCESNPRKERCCDNPPFVATMHRPVNRRCENFHPAKCFGPGGELGQEEVQGIYLLCKIYSNTENEYQVHWRYFPTSDTFVLELDVCIYKLRDKETRIDAIRVEDREHEKSIEET